MLSTDGISNVRKPLDSSFQGVKRLFVLAYDDSTNNDGSDANGRVKIDSYQKHFLPRVDIKNYNILTDGKNFYDQPINDLNKKYDEVRKAATGQGDDCTASCFLDYAYFDKNYKLIAVDFRKQKVLDTALKLFNKLYWLVS